MVDRDDVLAQLRQVFRDELADQLALLEKNTKLLERAGDDAAARKAAVAEIYRAAHSLKGAARAAAYPSLERFCHALESALGPARTAGTLDDGRVAALADVAATAWRAALARLDEGAPPDDAALRESERAILAVGLRQPAVVAPGVPVASRPPPPPPPPVPVEILESRRSLPSPEPVASTPRAPAGETVRVSVARLGELVVAAEEQLAISARGDDAVGALGGLELALLDARTEVRRAERATRARMSAASGARAANGPDELSVALGRALASLDTLVAGAEERVAQQSRAWRSAQSGAATVARRARALRVLSFNTLAPTLERAVTDASATLGRPVAFHVEGRDLEFDRRVLEGLREPLLHLVRNAVDHGIESPAERVARGKPPLGSLEVSAVLAGSEARVLVRDDGRGIDTANVRAIAREQGFASAIDANDRDVLALLFEPGFSTRRDVTALSGRGVGLDVVRQRVARLHGRVEIENAPGRGTTFVLTLPLDLGVMRGLVVKVRDTRAVLPTSAVARLARVRDSELISLEGRLYLADASGPIPLAELDATLGLPRPSGHDGSDVARPCVVLAVGDRRIALRVDALLDEREVVVQSLGARAKRSPFVAGAVLLAEGEVALLLDAGDLARIARPAATPTAEETATGPRTRVLVVDDSITTRQLERTLLEAAGYDVAVASDGEQAWAQLSGDEPFDLVVSDLEMPNMDGFQLLARIRATARTARLPVVLVTALASDADRHRAMELGASAYVTKGAFDQDTLLDAIDELL